MTVESTSNSNTTESTGRTPQQLVFSLPGNMRFRRISPSRAWDAFLDGINSMLEGFVYLLGPVLIVLALSIIGLLTYTFFHILLPMLDLKYKDASYRVVILGLHCLWVIFVVASILFNYFMCVTTRNVGPHYDKLVRELAEATDFSYPETPEAIALYRRDFEDRMVLRMRRRQARAAQAITDLQSDNNTGVTQRRGAVPTATTPATTPPPKPLRQWMLMTPYEWGYCGNSNRPKPPRSHYDHVSKALVLNLDHYCPWMFNAST
jgi:palmitoyltransferase